MGNDRKSVVASILVAVLLLALPIAAYVGGYFALSAYGQPIEGSHVAKRLYSTQWQATFFRPAATVEGWMSGLDVRTTHILFD